MDARSLALRLRSGYKDTPTAGRRRSAGFIRSTAASGYLACIAAVTIIALAGCGLAGDTASIKTATRLAIDCQTDEALAALDQAEQGGGLGEYLAGLERVAILRDAGRDAEASRALAAYKERQEGGTMSDADIEDALDDFVEDLRKERRDKTGSATCPKQG